MRLADAVTAAIGRNQGASARMGTVTAIDAVNLSLTLDIGTGTPLTGVRWIASYTPAIKDFVVLLRVEYGWWVLGKNSKDLTGPGFVEQSLFVNPTEWVLGGKWDFPPPDNSWEWSGAFDIVQQGTTFETDYADRTYAALCFYESIAAQIPSGAVVTTGRVRFARIQSIWDGGSGVPLVSPVISGHARATLPGPTQTPESFIMPAYKDWRPGKLAIDQAGWWALPSTWLSALIAGSVRGLVIYSTRRDDYSVYQSRISGTLEITYRMPA